jgi:hypothetical protein
MSPSPNQGPLHWLILPALLKQTVGREKLAAKWTLIAGCLMVPMTGVVMLLPLRPADRQQTLLAAAKL